MSSEHSLWVRIRDAIGHHGHLTRLEFNPEAGIPDVDFCLKRVEGKIELKHRHDEPTRPDTSVFTHHGLRPAQVIWIFNRARAGGRVFILPQVGQRLYLIPGSYCRIFNSMTLRELDKASVWSAGPQIRADEWRSLVDDLISTALTPTLRPQRLK